MKHLRRILPQARGQDGTGSGTGPRALARLLRIARPLVAELGDGIDAAVRQSRAEAVLLSTMVAPLGYQVAEAAGIPWAGVFLQPVGPPAARPRGEPVAGSAPPADRRPARVRPGRRHG